MQIKEKLNIKRGDQIGLSYFGHLGKELLREGEEKRERKRGRRERRAKRYGILDFLTLIWISMVLGFLI